MTIQMLACTSWGHSQKKWSQKQKCATFFFSIPIVDDFTCVVTWLHSQNAVHISTDMSVTVFNLPSSLTHGLPHCTNAYCTNTHCTSTSHDNHNLCTYCNFAPFVHTRTQSITVLVGRLNSAKLLVGTWHHRSRRLAGVDVIQECTCLPYP